MNRLAAGRGRVVGPVGHRGDLSAGYIEVLATIEPAGPTLRCPHSSPADCCDLCARTDLQKMIALCQRPAHNRFQTFWKRVDFGRAMVKAKVFQ